MKSRGLRESDCGGGGDGGGGSGGGGDGGGGVDMTEDRNRNGRNA